MTPYSCFLPNPWSSTACALRTRLRTITVAAQKSAQVPDHGLHPDPPSTPNCARLRAKHPPGPPVNSLPQCPEHAPRIIVDPEQLAKDIRSSAKGTAAGISGRTAELLIPLVDDDVCLAGLTSLIHAVVIQMDAPLPSSPLPNRPRIPYLHCTATGTPSCSPPPHRMPVVQVLHDT